MDQAIYPVQSDQGSMEEFLPELSLGSTCRATVAIQHIKHGKLTRSHHIQS
jgi:hypothetical protein